jgi:hypothetical protein
VNADCGRTPSITAEVSERMDHFVHWDKKAYWLSGKCLRNKLKDGSVPSGAISLLKPFGKSPAPGLNS